MSESSTPHSRPIAIAPAPNGKPAQHDSGNDQSTMAFTCVTCARRKVKCDKTAPTCSTCRKARLECTYQEPAPRKRKRKPVDDVHERLEYYEKLLKQHGIIPQDETTKSSPQEPEGRSEYSQKPFWVSKPQPNETTSGKLLGGEGKTRYIDSNMWRHLGDDLQASSDEEEDVDEPPASHYPSNPNLDPVSAALLSPTSPSTNLLDFHPTYESAMKLWKIYVENIDPVIKVVHVPTALLMLKRAASNPSSASKSTECLLFSIYHFAVSAISDSECEKKFGEPRLKLLARYHDAVRQALVNACFLRTTDLNVFQSYVLLLLAVRNVYDPHTFWILTGIAVRIAQRIGLHRDGEDLGLKPFDVQLRRRIFFQLLPLDGLSAQLCGTGICITPDSWSVKQPLNINDEDMWPDMKDTPTPHVGATDMIFCLARTEIANFVQKANPAHPNWGRVWEIEDVNEKERQLTALEDIMEAKYLRYCDFANPIHHLTMAMIRGAVNSGRLRIRLPRAKAVKDISDEERRKVWTISMRIIDYTISAHNDNLLRPYMWHMEAFFQFDPLIWILNELRRDPVANQDEDVWSKVEKIYGYHPQMLDQKRALHVATGRLTVKAWDQYHSRLAQEGHPWPTEPFYITTLRWNASKKRSPQDSAHAEEPNYNPFNPGDAFEDLRGPDITVPMGNPNDIDFNQMMGVDMESIDWMFWDQLVRDPTSFPTS